VIKGKRKNLDPEENLGRIIEANAELPAWRQVIRRPHRRVAIAYFLGKDSKIPLWAEFEWQRRYYRDVRGQVQLGSVITYRRESEKPKGGFIADGKGHSIERQSGEIVKVSYAFAQDKTISVPDDIVVAFREVWHINIDKDLTSQAYKKWKADNLPQNK
jgi:hypothetical protein